MTRYRTIVADPMDTLTADRRAAVARVVYDAHHRHFAGDGDGAVPWDELPESARRHWVYIAGEVLRYLACASWDKS